MNRLLSYILPQKLAEYHTKWNHYIRVNDEYGERKLLVNGSPQSGRYIRYLWKSSFKAFQMSNYSIKNVLVLGVGGGTVIQLVHKMYPDVRVTGVDIDPVMVTIAKKYFFQNTYPYVTWVVEDANTYVKKHHEQYDCIIVDLFSGRIIPEFVTSKVFLENIRKILRSPSVVCFNYLQELEYRKKSDMFKKTLLSVFPFVLDFKIARNRFFFASIV